MAVLCVALFADESANTARVRIRTTKGVETRRVPLVRTGENAARFTFRRADLPQGAKWLDVVPDFMTARRGEDGYWIQGRIGLVLGLCAAVLPCAPRARTQVGELPWVEYARIHSPFFNESREVSPIRQNANR